MPADGSRRLQCVVNRIPGDRSGSGKHAHAPGGTAPVDVAGASSRRTRTRHATPVRVVVAALAGCDARPRARGEGGRYQSHPTHVHRPSHFFGRTTRDGTTVAWGKSGVSREEL